MPRILVPDARRALADLAAAWAGHPSKGIGLIGVTGTDGKTTTTHLTSAILNAAGIRAGHISTVALDWGSGTDRNRTANTTPDALIIQENLARMRDAGVRVGVLEVSSHALVTERVRGCHFDCAVFTNLAPEHLDFHRTFEAYRAAKARLFAMLGESREKGWGKLGIVNAADPSAATMRAAGPAMTLGFGLIDGAEIRGEIVRENLTSTLFRVRTPDGTALLRSHLPGRYNVLNWLAAIGAARQFGADLSAARRAAERFTGVPGRLEAVRCGQPFEVFVDFAHTPQGLATTLDLLRGHTRGRLIALFGQAGHRDTANRGPMAEAVARRADLSIITTDDPYDEDPQSIIDGLSREMARAGRSEGVDYWRIPDRREAISFALSLARPGDCVLLAGRGPEEVTIIRGQRIPLVDAEVAREALTRHAAA